MRITPQQNGLAERMNRTLMDKVRSMLATTNLPKTLWTETLLTTCYLVNLSPSSAIDFKTSYKKWTGQLVDYENLRAFSCPAYVHTSQGKLAPRALKGFFFHRVFRRSQGLQNLVNRFKTTKMYHKQKCSLK